MRATDSRGEPFGERCCPPRVMVAADPAHASVEAIAATAVVIVACRPGQRPVDVESAGPRRWWWRLYQHNAVLPPGRLWRPWRWLLRRRWPDRRRGPRLRWWWWWRCHRAGRPGSDRLTAVVVLAAMPASCPVAVTAPVAVVVEGGRAGEGEGGCEVAGRRTRRRGHCVDRSVRCDDDVCGRLP